jgi:hypothetical protein
MIDIKQELLGLNSRQPEAFSELMQAASVAKYVISCRLEDERTIAKEHDGIAFYDRVLTETKDTCGNVELSCGASFRKVATVVLSRELGSIFKVDSAIDSSKLSPSLALLYRALIASEAVSGFTSNLLERLADIKLGKYGSSDSMRLTCLAQERRILESFSFALDDLLGPAMELSLATEFMPTGFRNKIPS